MTRARRTDIAIAVFAWIAGAVYITGIILVALKVAPKPDCAQPTISNYGRPASCGPHEGFLK